MEQHTNGTTPTSEERNGHPRTHQIRRVLLAVLALNVLVAVVKIAYGLMTESVSITADGLNSLMDGAANVVGLVGLAIAARPPDPNHPYGHHRFETLTSLAIAGFMLLALEQILQRIWERWQTGGEPEVSVISFVVMVGTLAINFAVVVLERRNGRRLNSSILIADARHTTSDIFVTLSVLLGLAAVRLGFPVADLLVALVVAGVIAWGAWTIVRDAALTLTDVAVAAAREIDRAARSVPGVKGVHNIRTRGSDGLVWVDLHIQVDKQLRVDRAHEIASNVAGRVEEEIGEPADVTVHVEPADSAHLRPHRGYDPERR